MAYFTKKAKILAIFLDNILDNLNFKSFLYGKTRCILHFYQRITRGFSDKEIWNLDHTMAEFVLPRLKRLREVKAGIPGNLEEDEWEDILDKIELSLTMITLEWEPDKVTRQVRFYDQEDTKIIQEGLGLLAEYWRGLWW